MAVTVATVFLLGCAVVDLLLASFIWSRRQGGAGRALTMVLVAVALWAVAYSGELLSSGEAAIRWGDAKYVGIGLLVPAWLAFIVCWTGRERLITSRMLVAVAVEPLAVLVLLALPLTHDLVRYTDPTPSPGQAYGAVLSGPLFWPHLVYNNVILVGATILFVVDLLRRSQHYRWHALALLVAVLLPFVANLGFNLSLGPLAMVDLTPIAFTVSGAVLAWAMIEQRLLLLAPIAHRQVVQGMGDGVLVADPLGHVLEANPAALEILGWGRGHRHGWRGNPLPERLRGLAERAGDNEIRFPLRERLLDLDVKVSELPDARGHAGARLLVLRDVSERREQERQRASMMSEQARVAATLSRSLRPRVLPQVPGVQLGAVYRTAGAGHEIGGDFYDVYAARDQWAFAIGDVSGKGAASAVVTAMARYTLRALTHVDGSPSAALAQLNHHLFEDEGETYVTVAHGRFRPVPGGGLEVLLALGGHPRPLLLPAHRGPVRPVGEPGTVIGLLADIETHDTVIGLGPADALVLYTDGVTEARAGKQFFGEEALIATLEAARGADTATIAEHVLTRVLAFQDQVAADDIAVLVIKAWPS